MLSEQTNIDLIGNINNFSKNTKKIFELTYFLKQNTSNKQLLMKLGVKDKFNTVESLLEALYDLYKFLGESDEKRFMIGVHENQISSPIYFAFENNLTEEQREEIATRLNVNVVDVANNIVRLVPR